MTFDLSDAARREARSWFVLFQTGEPDAQERARFAAWLREPAHQRAYVEAERSHAFVRQARDAGLFRAKPYRPMPSLWMAAAAALIVAVAGGALLYQLSDGDYRTAAGEMRTITLEDGSTVYMNGGTRFAVRFSGKERLIQLHEGEALFQVAKDADRPFRVDAGNQIAQAVGTAFDVVRTADNVEIAVSEGVVNVLPALATSKDPVPARSPAPTPLAQLRPGQAIVYEGKIAPAGVRAVPVDRIGAWRHGELVFESVPFARILDALSRHYGGKFTVDDPALARRSVSLQLNPQSRAEMIQFIEQTMSLRAQERTAGTITFVTLRRK